MSEKCEMVFGILGFFVFFWFLCVFCDFSHYAASFVSTGCAVCSIAEEGVQWSSAGVLSIQRL